MKFRPLGRHRAPDNIRANLAFADTTLDHTPLADVLAILRPIHGFNYARGLPAHPDPILS